MPTNRPDLSGLDPEIRRYIESLESELARLRESDHRKRAPVAATAGEESTENLAVVEPSEPETTIQVLTFTRSGYGKRTPRHLYTRQRRGGMGVFDLETPKDEPPAILALADESANLLLLTNLGRAFRLPVSAIPAGEVRDRGASVLNRYPLLEGEQLAVVLSEQAQGYLGLLTERGNVRLLRHHVFGDSMKPGTSLLDPRTLGALVAACWAPGDGDLFLATQMGKAIRFPEKLVPPAGGPGIRLTGEDQAVAIAAVYDDNGVFLLTEEGKGTIRQMAGFAANKSPGSGGKTAMNTGHLVSAAVASLDDDIFILSRLSKIIRFPAEHVPEKEGVVQGVIAMTLRADQIVALAVSHQKRSF